MPDPTFNTYARYRDGLVKRHIACSGRYLSELWLKEYEPGQDSASLLRHQRRFTSPYIPGLQRGETRTYIPWLSREGVVYGGGENPLARGGIAMATFAVEYLVKKQPSSLRYARRLLRYFERCELVVSGQRTGFLLRCDNYFNVSGKLGMYASTDEIVGLMLGLYYLFLSTQDHPDIRKRIRALVNRIGAHLKASAYILIPPTEPAELHKGFLATYVFQWALQQVFQKVTGSRYEPTGGDYQAASSKLFGIFQGGTRYLKFGAKNEKQQWLALMWLWVKTGKVTGNVAVKWTQALSQSINDSNALMFAFGNFGPPSAALFDSLQADVNVEAFADPFRTYLATIRVQDVLTFWRKYDSWHNRAMTIHTLHYALDEEVLQANNDRVRAIVLTRISHGLLKTMLCGERLPKPVVYPFPPHYETGPMDDDLYAAVVAKGLLAHFLSLDEMKCYPMPAGTSGALVAFPYADRINHAIDRRSRLWDDLPASELDVVRTGEWAAPIRWHNSNAAKDAKKGADFCWERWRKDADETRRILGWDGKFHQTATGLQCKPSKPNYSDEMRRKLASGVDVLFEAGGLDFMFPRALMSYWFGEPLEFEDHGLPMLRAITCLPFPVNGKYREAPCTTGEWLLMSST